MPIRRAFLAAALLLVCLAGAAGAREPQAVLLGSNRDALAARAQLVRNASREINASAFLFASDRLGQMGLALLREKARRGVKVRLLVELTGRTRMHPPIPRSLLVHLAEEGVEIKFYNPPRGGNLLHFWRLGRRMHDKVLVVDGEELIVGGRNVAEAYFGLRPRPSTPLGPGVGHLRPKRDLDAHASGPAAAEAQAYFHELWAASHVMAPWAKGVRRASVEQAKASLDHYDRLLARPKVVAFFQHDWRAGARPLRSLKFVHDPVSLSERAPRLIEHWTPLFDAAKPGETITIVSAYGVPTGRMRELFRRTLARGVKVKLLVNSRRSNESLLQAAYETVAPTLAALGVEIWEYQGPEMLHAKAVLVGDRGYIGSANLDSSSERKNSETGMIFDSPELAADLRAFLADVERDSKLVTRNGKLLPDAWAPHESGARQLVWPVLKNASRFPPLYHRL